MSIAVLFTWAFLASAAETDDLGECPIYEPDTCPTDSDDLSDTEWLRALSLDLRGNIPTFDEYAAVASGDRLPEDFLDEWLDSPEFRDRVVRLHRAVLYNNLGGLPKGLSSDSAELYIASTATGTADDYFYRMIHPYARAAREACASRQATPDNPDGWVYVDDPFWAPGTTVKVCQPDANPAEFTPAGVACGSYAGSLDPACGCGPQLRYCNPPDWRERVVAGFNQEVEERIRHLLAADASYLDLLEGRTMWVNGPMVHYLRYQRWQAQSMSLEEYPVDASMLPNLPATAESTWRPVTLGPEQSGVLTSAAYLMRFTVNRARAKRFYEGFRCEPFVPPPDGIALGTSTSLDVAKRPGCSSCHYTLEPAAATWGRWMPFGAGYLDPAEYPSYNEECRTCAALKVSACSAVCRNAYVVDAVAAEQNPYLGQLAALQFLSEDDRILPELGPKELVRRSVADGSLQACVASTAAEQFLGVHPDAALRDTLIDAFVGTGWSYAELVRAIVTSDAYRRAL
jgi:hypothetical protein